MTRENHLQTKSTPHGTTTTTTLLSLCVSLSLSLYSLSCLVLLGLGVDAAEKFPAGEIPLLEVNRGEKEGGFKPLSLSPLRALSF